jgi:hypothetical protein
MWITQALVPQLEILCVEQKNSLNKLILILLHVLLLCMCFPNYIN